MTTENPEEPQVLRQHLVDEAAKFLMNPNVARHADDQKTAFLQKKGLTDNEIQAAFARAKSQLPVVGTSAGPVVPVGSPASVPVPSYAYMPPPPSMWIRIRDICNFALIITGASYGAYHLYKNYIGPLLTGRRQKSVEESMIELQQSVVAVLKEVQTTLSSLEQTLSAQNVRIQNLSAKEEKGHTSHQLEDLKTEITSLKGLLINRRTFPATPSMSQSIPSWQLAKASEKTMDEPAVSAPTVPTQIQDESVKSEEILVKNGEQISEEIITDGPSEESGVCMNDSNEEDSNPSSFMENGHSAVESLAELAGDSSDEMSQ